MFFIGQAIRLTAAFTVADVATDPTTVSLTVEKPDGTEATYTYAGGTVTKDGTGNYHKDIVPATTEHGIWQWRWVGTGAVASSDQGAFVVEQSNV